MINALKKRNISTSGQISCNLIEIYTVLVKRKKMAPAPLDQNRTQHLYVNFIRFLLFIQCARTLNSKHFKEQYFRGHLGVQKHYGATRTILAIQVCYLPDDLTQLCTCTPTLQPFPLALGVLFQRQSRLLYLTPLRRPRGFITKSSNMALRPLDVPLEILFLLFFSENIEGFHRLLCT